MAVEVKDDNGGKQGGVLLTYGGVLSLKQILVGSQDSFKRDVICSFQDIHST